MDIPEINNRIRQLVDFYAKGKVLKFSEMIGVKQQTVNRLFNIDTRTGKYPVVTTDVLIAITEMLVDVNATWILTGRGSMLRDELAPPVAEPTILYKSDPKDAEIIKAKQMIIERDAELIISLRSKVKELEAKLYDHTAGLHSAPAADTPSVGGCQTSAK